MCVYSVSTKNPPSQVVFLLIGLYLGSQAFDFINIEAYTELSVSLDLLLIICDLLSWNIAMVSRFKNIYLQDTQNITVFQEKSIHLFDLPEEMVEEITSYLDFEDLKLLSQTCKYLDEITWRILCHISKVKVRRVLSHADIGTFTETKKIFENVKICFDIEFVLAQLSTISSIKLHNIFFNMFYLDRSWRILKKYEDQIRTMTVAIEGNEEDIMNQAHEIRSQFPEAKITFKLKFDDLTSMVSFDDMNAELSFPTRMCFVENSLENLLFHKQVYNVETLTFMHCADKLHMSRALPLFKNLKVLELYDDEGFEPDFLEAVIENNKDTLVKLSLLLCEPWYYHFPCQFQELHLTGVKDKHSSRLCTHILKNQKHLRRLTLKELLITKNITNEISEKTLLSSIEFENCSLEDPLEPGKIGFLNRIGKITCIHTDYHGSRDVEPFDVNLLNVIFDNSEKLTRLELKDYARKYYFLPCKKTVLKHLKFLKIAGFEPVPEAIIAPNLEVCQIEGCDPAFLLGCKQLRRLHVKKITTHDQIVKILKSNPFLENAKFSIHMDEFEQNITYILENIGAIKNFEFYLYAVRGECPKEDLMQILKSALKIPGTKWTKFQHHYTFETFSFAIRYYEFCEGL